VIGAFQDLERGRVDPQVRYRALRAMLHPVPARQDKREAKMSSQALGRALGSAALACLITLGTLGTVLAQSPPTVRIRGEIQTLEGNVLTIATREGDTATVKLADDFGVSAVVPADMAAIEEGSFIGTAAMPQPGGELRALEVLVFPEALRGTGEGHYPWDLMPESTMTNATVSSTVSSREGRNVTLTYQGEERTVFVPEDVPIVTLESGDATLLTPGNHVFINAQEQADGTLTAARVAVGKDGLVPPM
jgi:hypothetical protein